jgi:hypothetical protein
MRVTTNFFGVDISNTNFMYEVEAYGRVFYIHPAVIEENGGKFEFPVHNVSVIEVTKKTIVVAPGDGIMRVFEVRDGEIEDAYNAHMMYYSIFDQEEWKEKTKAVVMVSTPGGKKPIVEWVDNNGSRWMTTVDMETGTIETVPNPNPPPPSEEE